MFDYNSSETIINSATLTDGTTAAWKVLNQVVDTTAAPVAGEDPFINYFGGAKALQVTRVAKYIDKFIQQVWVTKPVVATMSSISFTIPALVASTVYRLNVDAILDGGSNAAEYARWAIHKGKPYLIEFTTPTALSNASTDYLATAFVIAKIKSGLKNIDLGELELTVTSTGTTNVTITAKNENVRFVSAIIEELSPVTGTTADLEGDVLSTFATGTVTQGVSGVGTYNYMYKNLRIPTVEAIRFAGTFQDELPLPGQLYTQFSVEYLTNREITGNNAIGAPAQSKTRHTFFVLGDYTSSSTVAYTFYNDLQTVLGSNAAALTSVVGLSITGSGDNILETTTDNRPI